MYVKKLHLRGYGPVNSLALSPSFDEFGNPTPLIIVGVNGSGKSLLLSTILDAMVTMRSKVLSDSPEMPQGQLFKPLTQRILNFGTAPYALAQCEFGLSKGNIVFTELVARAKDGDKFVLPDYINEPKGFEAKQYAERGLSKFLSEKPAFYQADLNQAVLAYYPAGRAERPSWLNESSPINFDVSPNYIDTSKYTIWRTNIVAEIERWVLDIVLDAELYDRNDRYFTLETGELLQAYVPVQGRNRRILNHLNTILSSIIVSANPDYIRARFAIAERRAGVRSVMIFAQHKDGSELTVARQLSDLSTGELVLFSMFADIVRIAELQGWDRERLDGITGIVLVDEADIHLHIKIQKEVFPALIRQMPQVQFILTTHSPFLVLGLAEHKVDIVNLPDGAKIAPADFNEFDEAYRTFIHQNDSFRDQYRALRIKLRHVELPLIITEGKTDWRHLQYALGRFQAGGEYVDLQVTFHETADDIGSAELKKIYETFAKVPPINAVICIFDRDELRIVNEFSNGKSGFLASGRVVGMCLAVPAHRIETPEICIEHLHTDEALNSVIPGTRKRLRFANEIGFASDRKTAFLRPNPATKTLKIFDQDVSLLGFEDGTCVGELAISKSAFLSNVVLGEPGTDFDLSGFRPTLDVLLKALRTVSNAA